eukprot:jgi/Hompol1/6290/HPOL_004918-RA
MEPQNQKYDRQLRLWQAHGQAKLQASHICLINGSAVGAETLKNLILPGIGSFTVIDDQVVTGAQAGRNFFLDKDSIGTSRAESLVRLLGELNDEVVGNAVHANVSQLIETNPAFFHKFTLVVATEMTELDMRRLAQICWSANIAFVQVRCYGFFGYCRIVKREHTMVETHDGQRVDYRLDCPFASLQELADSTDLDSMDSMAAGHVPFVVLLLKALKQWKHQHDGQLPSTSAEKAEFKKIVEGYKHPLSIDDENIAEALANAYRAWTVTKIPSEVDRILQHPSASNLTALTPNFWLLVAALRRFVQAEGKGLLPVSGVVPDMKSDTDSFVQLQQIYRAKARSDVLAVRKHLDAILSEIGRDASTVLTEEVERICKNSTGIKVFWGKSIEEEYTSSIGDVASYDSNMAIYWLLRAADQFYLYHNRYPGASLDTIAQDTIELQTIASTLISQNNIPQTLITDDLIAEIVRAGGSELHNIASLMGGIASQEIIKLVTEQYVSVDGAVVFNGVTSTTLSFKV